MKRHNRSALETIWINEFVVGGHCGLCGNTGKINTIGVARTPAGHHVGGVFYCICPNGRAIKRQMEAGDDSGGREDSRRSRDA